MNDHHTSPEDFMAEYDHHKSRCLKIYGESKTGGSADTGFHSKTINDETLKRLNVMLTKKVESEDIRVLERYINK